MAQLPSSLSEIVACCQRERHDRQHGQHASPCCIALFRRIVADPDEAFAHVQTIFRPLLLVWIGTQQSLDPDEIINLTWFAFWRAVQPPSDILWRDDQLGRVLAFLRTCTITTLLQEQRLRRNQPPPFVSLDDYETGLPLHETLPDPADMAAETDLRVTLHALIDRHLRTTEERLAVHTRFTLGWTPRQIVAAYPEQFPTPTALRTVLQRVVRRLQQDDDVRRLFD